VLTLNCKYCFLYQDLTSLSERPLLGNVLEGDTIRLNCVVSSSCNLTGVISFGSVINTKKNDSFHPGTSLQLSPSSSQLVITNISMVEHKTKIYCKVDEHESECIYLQVFSESDFRCFSAVYQHRRLNVLLLIFSKSNCF